MPELCEFYKRPNMEQCFHCNTSLTVSTDRQSAANYSLLANLSSVIPAEVAPELALIGVKVLSNCQSRFTIVNMFCGQTTLLVFLSR